MKFESWDRPLITLTDIGSRRTGLGIESIRPQANRPPETPRKPKPPPKHMFHCHHHQQTHRGTRMYGLPSDPKLDVALKGQTLVQVCVGTNDLFLNFSGDVSIGVYFCIASGSSHDTLVSRSDFVEASQDLLKVLSVDVREVTWNKNGTIMITFDTGFLIELHDDSQQFESYTIRTSSGLIVV
jgi:Family of unknown function (DUF6188)